MRPEINDLRKKISESVDYTLFDEAAKCLEAKAFRAAYIMTFICIAESLRNKLVVMSERDAEVSRIVGRIEEAEQKGRPTDKLLLEKAFNIGIITQIEFEKLENIRKMRGIYAHPIGESPSEIEAFASLYLAVEVVLSKPPFLRHGYVNNYLLKSLFEDRHFLVDDPDKIQRYATDVARRVHPGVLPYLVEKLTERLERIFDDPEKKIFLRRGLKFGTSILACCANLLTNNWDVLTIVQKYPTAGSLLFSIPDVFLQLQTQEADMVFGNLIEPVKGTKIQPPTALGLQRARELSLAGFLTDSQKVRLSNSIERTSLITLQEAGFPLKEYVEKVITYLNSHNWYKQNPAARALMNAGADECNKLEQKIQEQLGRSVLASADGGAWDAGSLINEIERGETIWPKVFVEGLILETLVNEIGVFRFKKDYFDTVVKIGIKHPNAESIFARVVKEVRCSKPRDKDLDYYNEASATIDKIHTQDGKTRQCLDLLVDAIKQVKSQVANST